MIQRLVGDHVLVDKPVAEGAALDLATTVVEDVLGAWVGRAAVALFNAVTVHTVWGTTAWMLWRLLLVVVKAGAPRCCAVVVPIACRDMERSIGTFPLPTRIRRVGESLELDEPRGVFGIVEFFPNAGVPVKGLDGVAVCPDAWRVSRHARVLSVHHLSLLSDEFLGRHWVGVRPDRFGVAPVIDNDAKLVGVVHVVHPTVVARVQHCRVAHVPRWLPCWQALSCATRTRWRWRRRWGGRRWSCARRRSGRRLADRGGPPPHVVEPWRGLGHVEVRPVGHRNRGIANEVVHGVATMWHRRGVKAAMQCEVESVWCEHHGDVSSGQCANRQASLQHRVTVDAT
mmetsp:Transcript_15476/g.40050  ORF Transcript_15476/g.40050 Transcript_15476/m.40050 type:complete len:342 (+) Transcript_15476:778-1803(+)